MLRHYSGERAPARHGHGRLNAGSCMQQQPAAKPIAISSYVSYELLIDIAVSDDLMLPCRVCDQDCCGGRAVQWSRKRARRLTFACLRLSSHLPHADDSPAAAQGPKCGALMT
jgi:hypothetical protein